MFRFRKKSKKETPGPVEMIDRPDPTPTEPVNPIELSGLALCLWCRTNPAPCDCRSTTVETPADRSARSVPMIDPLLGRVDPATGSYEWTLDAWRDRSIELAADRPEEPTPADRSTEPTSIAEPKPEPVTDRSAEEPALVDRSTEPEPDRSNDPIRQLMAIGRSGKKRARKLLAERADRSLNKERRADEAEAAQARLDARRERIERAAPSMVYLLAIGFAVGGQVHVIASKLEMDWGVMLKPLTTGFLQATAILVVAVGAAGLIEGSGLAFASLTTKARMDGRRSVLTRCATWTCAMAACVINAAGHWGSIWAYPTALGSIVALGVWEAETWQRCYKKLAETQAEQRRRASVRRLVYKALRHNHDRRQSWRLRSTMTQEVMDGLVADVVKPTSLVEMSMRDWTASITIPKPIDRPAPEKAPIDQPAKESIGEPTDRPIDTVKPEADRSTRTVKAVKSAEKPIDAVPADRSITTTPIAATPIDRPKPETKKSSTDRTDRGVPVAAADRSKPRERRAVVAPIADPAEEWTGSIAPADLTPAADRGDGWLDRSIPDRLAAVLAECSARPSDAQLAAAAGCSKNRANGWRKQSTRELVAV